MILEYKPSLWTKYKLFIIHKRVIWFIIFFTGAHELKNSRYAQFYRIISYKMHENYDTRDFPNDIAVIKIDGRIRFGMYVQPVCLPKKNKDIPIGSECYVTGMFDFLFTFFCVDTGECIRQFIEYPDPINWTNI